MKKSFLVPTTAERINDCKKMIESIAHYLSADWNIYMTLQCYTKEQEEDMVSFVKNICKNDFQYLSYDSLIGTHTARIVILEKFKSDIWCSVDDDMIMLDKYTNYDPMAKFLWEHTSIGLLSSVMIEDKEEYYEFLKNTPLINYAVPRKIVLTGGGLMFKDNIAKLLVERVPKVAHACDNTIWSITCYVNGYTQAVYYGSAAIHLFRIQGGRKVWIKKIEKYQPPVEFINPKQAKEYINDYTFTEDMVTEEADKLYNKNRKF